MAPRIGKGLMKPRTGEAEREMEERIRAIGRRERAKAGKADDLVIRHDPSIVRSRP